MPADVVHERGAEKNIPVLSRDTYPCSVEVVLLLLLILILIVLWIMLQTQGCGNTR